MDDLRRVARDEGVPTIMNIHDVSLARAYADRIIGITQGAIVFDGRPADLDDRLLDRIYRRDSAQEETVGDDRLLPSLLPSARPIPDAIRRARSPSRWPRRHGAASPGP